MYRNNKSELGNSNRSDNNNKNVNITRTSTSPSTITWKEARYQEMLEARFSNDGEEERGELDRQGSVRIVESLRQMLRTMSIMTSHLGRAR